MHATACLHGSLRRSDHLIPSPALAHCDPAPSQVVKNHFASEYIYNKYKNEKTCDVIERDAVGGMSKVAEPVGVIAGELP